MLSARFLIHGAVPWKEGEVTALVEAFEQARQEILQCQFNRATETLNNILKSEQVTTVAKFWANLLLTYVSRLWACILPEQKKSAQHTLGVKHYIGASSFNEKLAYEEPMAYGSIVRWFTELVVSQKKSTERPLPLIQNQGWQIYFVDSLFKQKKYQEALDCITKSLKEFPQNHGLLFFRSRIHYNQSMMSEVEADLTRAIEICSDLPELEQRLSCYYLHRARARHFLKNFKGVVDDFLKGTLDDDNPKDVLDHEFRREVLKIFQAAQMRDPDAKKQLKDWGTLRRVLIQDPTNIDLLLKKASIYESADQKTRACVEYLVIHWIIKTELSTHPSLTFKQVEEKLRSLGDEERKKTERLHQDEEEKKHGEQLAQKKKEKRERQKQRKQEEKRQEEKRLVEEKEALENQRQEQEQKNIIQNVISEIVSVIEEKEYQEQLCQEQKAAEEVTIHQAKEQAQQKMVIEEEIIFDQDLYVWIPAQILDFMRDLKALEGRMAQRIHFYGGIIRDQALNFNQKNLNFNVGTGLALEVVAGRMKAFFKLSEEPKIKYNLVQISFSVMDYRTDTFRLATLTVSQRKILTEVNLAYTEALREDALSWDVIQNAFVATVPEEGEYCPAYYPLNWWDLYFSLTVEAILLLLHNARDRLRGSLNWLRGQAIFLVGTGPEYQVYGVVNNHLDNERPGQILQLNFTMQLSKTDMQCLIGEKYGRVRLSLQNQFTVKGVLQRIKDKFTACYKAALDSMKSDPVSRLMGYSSLETILGSVTSFYDDPIRMLRAIHLTTSLGFKALSPQVLQGMMNDNVVLSFRSLIRTNPGKVNSWFHKLLCRDGKPCLFHNFNYLKDTNLLYAAFPELQGLVGHANPLYLWFIRELQMKQDQEKISLNQVYALFAVYIATATRRDTYEVIGNNILLGCNFRDFDPLELLDGYAKSWKNFYEQYLSTVSCYYQPNQWGRFFQGHSQFSYSGGGDPRASHHNDAVEQQSGQQQRGNRRVG